MIERFSSKAGFKQSEIIANNLLSSSDINLTSQNSSLNISSSNLLAQNNINLNARKGEINITASSNDSNSFSKSFAASLSIPIIGKGGAGSISFSKSKSDSQDYLNSSLVAKNQFNLNSGSDANIISSNILAKDINMLVAGNLNLESKQNTSNSNSNSFGFGAGSSESGGGKSGNLNLSYSQSNSDRNWVDNQASIIGTDSVAINVGKNTNLTGSVIANSTNALELFSQSGSNNGSLLSKNGIDGGNLTLNTGTFTYSNLYDSDFARSIGIGLSATARAGTTNSSSADNGIRSEATQSQAQAVLRRSEKSGAVGNSGGSGSGAVGGGAASGSGSKGNTSLSFDYSMHDITQTTNAVIGSGSIRTGTKLNLDANNNLISIDYEEGNSNKGSPASVSEATQGLNRNIAQSQIITKSLTVDPIDVEETFEFDGRNKPSEERRTIWGDLKNKNESGFGATTAVSGLWNNATSELKEIGTKANPINAFSNSTYGIATDIRNAASELNLSQETTSKTNQIADAIQFAPYNIAAAPVVGAISVSKWIDGNNSELKPDGTITDHPAPNLWPGNILDKDDEPSVGRGDDSCRNNFWGCGVWISDYAPHLQALHYGVPGFKSFSQFHDAAMIDKKTNQEAGAAYKFFSIFPYLPANYYGAIGTHLDQSTYEFNKPKNQQ